MAAASKHSHAAGRSVGAAQKKLQQVLGDTACKEITTAGVGGAESLLALADTYVDP